MTRARFAWLRISRPDTANAGMWAIGMTPRQYEGTTVGALFTTQAIPNQ